MTRSSKLLAVLAFSLSACGAGMVDMDDSASLGVEAPALAASDQADHSCRVVQREMGRQPGGSDYQTVCQGAVCNYLWVGHVDVSRDAFPAGATVGVLYHLASDPKWYEVTATQSDGGLPGFWYDTYQISDHLFGPGLTAAQLAAVRIELIPYVKLADGSRLFDHNRRAGDLDNYKAGQSDNFAVGDDARFCKTVAGTLNFQQNWQNTLGGMLNADGWLSIWYDLSRLPNCRATHNGYPAWDLEANVKFLPSGKIVTGSVRSFQTVNGTPTNSADPKRLDVKIPADTTAVELWFHNWSGAGNNCEAWDSNYGANYRFDVFPDVNDPRCQGFERWTSQYGGAPTCVTYPLSSQADASSCEFYLNGFGHGFEGHYGIPFDWTEAYLVVKPQQGQLLNVGMFTRYSDNADGSVHTRFSLGTAIDPTTWKTGFTFNSTATQTGTPGYTYTVQQMAFFIDVKRADGTVVRLWQSRHGADYSWNDAFGAGVITNYIPYGHVDYSADSAVILDTRRACR